MRVAGCGAGRHVDWCGRDRIARKSRQRDGRYEVRSQDLRCQPSWTYVPHVHAGASKRKPYGVRVAKEATEPEHRTRGGQPCRAQVAVASNCPDVHEVRAFGQRARGSCDRAFSLRTCDERGWRSDTAERPSGTVSNAHPAFQLPRC